MYSKKPKCCKDVKNIEFSNEIELICRLRTESGRMRNDIGLGIESWLGVGIGLGIGIEFVEMFSLENWIKE